jgi:mono/diheme cytochrome c family protein
MAATDQTYRNQRTLDVVFGVSCVLMLLSVLWMFWQDYNREFKAVQRQFRDVEEAVSEHAMLAALPSAEEVKKKRKAIVDARDDLKKVQAEVRPTELDLMARRDIQDNTVRSIKAVFDSKTSLYNIAVEHYGKVGGAAREEAAREVAALDKEVKDLQAELTAAQDALDKTDREIEAKVSKKLRPYVEDLARAEDDLKKQTAAFDRLAKTTAQKRWKFGDTFRALPIIDGFASPVKINQIWLPDLTIDYSFKEVPRFDRCTSCHLGIDRGNYDKARLTELASPAHHAMLVDDLKKAEKILRERQKEGEDLGFDVSDLPHERRASIWTPAGIVLLTFLMIAVIVGVVEHSSRLGWGMAGLGVLAWGATAWGLHWAAPVEPAVKEVNLTPGQVTQFAAHPRLDLFVDANSPHPMEKFGCTICHSGQGSATDFQQADHSPADVRQQDAWKKEYHWHADHFWDYPMLSSRFVEASCAKCHHQMTDLISHGSKEEAPKLLRGYNLVRENGCFGCHEIAGLKSGREVGPDLRLEPTPALEYLSPSEQEKAKSDPLNPPGTYRKVGPSLRRIAEKTNQAWARKWIQAPRDFRPDTKMPHFYGLSNNDAHRAEALPAEQKKFPSTEIHAIAYYLFAESKGALEGKDTTRQYLESRLKDLHGILEKKPLDDRYRKELADATRRLVDLMLLSAPAKAATIDREAGDLRRLQERVQELQKQKAEGSLAAAEDKELEKASKDLSADRLLEAGRLVPLSQQLIGEDGVPVSLPAAPAAADRAKHIANGRRLFSEKGCLACHTHAGTARAGDGLPGVVSQANFGPNLSRLAAKIAPEIADAKDLETAKRRWVVQWVMNPNVYHPRTRMPITHLSPEDASDVAEWLLSQKVDDWKEADPAEPTTDDLVELARVYLLKAPGMTRLDVENILPTTPGKRPGISEERLSIIREQAPDADELRLAGPIDDDEKGRDKLKWYIGRKAINRLGCFGCHDVPGFETAKPIGTALNDWGKKDPERLAFEDADVFVKAMYNIVDVRNDPRDPAKPAADWHSFAGKRPYERIFYEALEHHRREGFLHLKLEDPRSFDYHRIRTWDDRLRMPQFRFARAVRRDGESAKDFEARQELEEAEAREAVMTFVLSLTAEAIPAKYLNHPGPDRLAEVKGRQVLDKFNCAGCHQIRPGLYEFKPTDDALEQLQESYKTALSSIQRDYHFPGHSAWTGTAPTSADRTIAYGSLPKIEERDDRKLLMVRLTDALRFTGKDGVVRDLPAGALAGLVPGDVKQTPAYGGAFTDLMVGYLTKKDSQTYKENDPDNQNARSVLPPPLVREGERVQPNWLYGFLLNPTPIRPKDYVLLRMPKFNLSPEEARQVVDYFTSTSRLTNPGAGVTAQYLSVEQRDPEFWKHKTKQYVDELKSKGLLEARIKEMGPAWELYLKQKLAEAEASLDAAKQAVKDAPEGEARKQKQKELDDREAAIKRWKEQLAKKDYKDLQNRWEADEAYAVDAFRSLANRQLCMQCHSVGSLEIPGSKGPNLALSAQRLRPEWTKLWIANPARLFPYASIMPVNFPNNAEELKSLKVPFAGTPLETVESVRDVLMDLPRLEELPGLRGPAGGGK